MNEQGNEHPSISERFAGASVRRGAMGLAVALLLAFGSCATIVAVRGGEPTGPTSPDTVAGITVTPSDTTSPTPPPGESETPKPDPDPGPGDDPKTSGLPDLAVSALTRDAVVVVNAGRADSGDFSVSVSGTSFAISGLTPGASAARSFDCRDGFLTSTADPSDAIAESNEANNERTEGPFDCESAEGPLPDLVVKTLTSTRVAVANIGNASSGPFSVTVSGSTFAFPSLRPGEASVETFGCREGTLAATADTRGAVTESNETNNSRSAGPFSCPEPDLIVSRLTRDSVSVLNQGDAPARPSSVKVEGNGSFPVPGLQPGASAQADFSCTEGTLTARADVGNIVAEGNETNNAMTAGPFSCPKPDLLVTSITNTSVTVKNSGNAAAAAFAISITGVGTPSIDGLGAGASKTVDFACTEGSITAKADPDNRIDESDEQNNALTVNGLTCPKPDLFISSVSDTSVTVKNIGDASAGSFTVTVTGRGPFQVGGLAAGASVTFDYSCVDDFTATADPTDQIDESNENNNSKSGISFTDCIA
jgi:subtilase family serine protease